MVGFPESSGSASHDAVSFAILLEFYIELTLSWVCYHNC